MNDIRSKMKIANDADFETFLAAQGITVEGLRRHFIRGTMSNIFTHELAKPAINSISVEILKAYYDQHEGEYHTNACVEWSEYVVSVNQNKLVPTPNEWPKIWWHDLIRSRIPILTKERMIFCGRLKPVRG